MLGIERIWNSGSMVFASTNAFCKPNVCQRLAPLQQERHLTSVARPRHWEPVLLPTVLLPEPIQSVLLRVSSEPSSYGLSLRRAERQNVHRTQTLRAGSPLLAQADRIVHMD